MMRPAEQQRWHAMDAQEVLQSLGTGLDGLTDEEARVRLEKLGPNELRKGRRISPLKIFVGQFKEFLVLILIAAALVSAAIGEAVDAIVILVIIVAIAVLGFIQEYRAERALEALKKMAAPTATARRRGKDKEIPSRDLVPGDIISLAVGDKIPADARIIESHNLRVNEASLTGESTPVDKDTKVIASEVSIADQSNMVFGGTVVTYGHALTAIVSTGMSTEFGKIAGMIESAEEERTPLQARLEHVGKWLGIACIVVVAAVSSLGLIQGYGYLRMFTWGVSLAVAAVPEALPAVVTGALAIGVQRMAKRNSIVRKLPAVETLGCTTVICVDKTGTLTKGEMTVRELFLDNETIQVTGTGYEPRGGFLKGVVVPDNRNIKFMLQVASLCNDARLEEEKGTWRVVGDPTEGALIVAAAKLSISQEEIRRQYPRVGELSFTSERKLMTTVHTTPYGRKIACVKGAPEVVLEKSKYLQKEEAQLELTDRLKGEILQANERMAAKALRVLAIAYKEMPEEVQKFDEESTERNLTFLGLVGMIDPPREEAKQAVELCKRAGVRVVMITGDHKLTATAIARELGLMNDTQLAMTGDELDKLNDNEFASIVKDVAVYARVSPEHKLRIVKALKLNGHVVAMTGDGANDAPALKSADIGISMGITGTDVSKEASDMILVDDNFASIVAAMQEGRAIYDNIKKYLAYLLSCNIGEILIMFIVSLISFIQNSHLPLPLIAVQILWVNLVTDGLPALALGVDPPDPDIMQRPPRDLKESVFTARVNLLIAVVAVTMTLFTIPVFLSKLALGEKEARTIVFTLIVMFEMFNAFNCRSERHSLLKVGFTKNRFLLIAVASSILLQLAVIYVPFLQAVFETAPLGVYDWALVILLSATVIVTVEASKRVGREVGRNTGFQNVRAVTSELVNSS